MGCGPSENLAVSKNDKITIYGDYFSSDTRAILAACKYAEIDYEF